MSADEKNRAIGKVISVTADKITAELFQASGAISVVGFDEMHFIAQLGSFVLIPLHTDYVVGEIVSVRESDQRPSGSRGGSSIDGEIRSEGVRLVDISPVGMLPKNSKMDFSFGVSNFPAVYSDVMYPLNRDLDRIFKTDAEDEPIPEADRERLKEQGFVVNGDPTRASRIVVGSSVVFEGYDVKVKVDEFFGGHSAVLGNTGSGKSCTVASIIQSLFSKQTDYRPTGASFLIFDVNGEYDQALRDISNSDDAIAYKQLELDGTANPNQFRLPHWFLNLDEWALLLKASEKAQLPILRTALGLTSLSSQTGEKATKVKQHFVSSCINACFDGSSGEGAVAQIRRTRSLLTRYATDGLNADLLTKHKVNDRFGNFPDGEQIKFLREVSGFIDPALELPEYTGAPFPFSALEEAIDFAILYNEAQGNKQVRDYCSQLVTRVQSLRDRQSFEFLKFEDNLDQTADSFLQQVLGFKADTSSLTKTDQIINLKMSDVDDETVELVTAVICRMVFQKLRSANPRNGYPVNLVLEEAHRYISEKPSRYAIDATEIFERVAKEGRKFGMFLMLASQRPSELSKTVLSQCANFIIHKIQNPDDLAQIRQMTPFVSSNVLARLPSLPKQHALIFGSAVNIPTTFRIRNATPTPHSNDADIRRLWYRPGGHPIDVSL